MKNKKLLWLPVVLLLIVLVLAACLLTKCVWDGHSDPEETQPTQGQIQPEPTQPEPTQPEPTETAPVLTEPVATEPEETEPEETTAPGSSGPSVNTGTGGGYDPGTTEPGATEPETDVTEPVIEVPPAGSEANPYYENIQNGAGEFTTVKIPAGATVYYRIQTAGAFLRVGSEDVSVIYEEPAQKTRDGMAQLELPADDSEPISLAFTNNSDEDQNFPVQIVGPVGSASNPIEVSAPDDISAALEKDDVDGLHYQWIADRDGMLKLWADSSKDVDINLFVNEKAVQLTQDNGGKLCAPVKAEDVLLVQLLAKSDSEGNVPAAEVKLHGYIAQMVDISVMFVPFEAEPVTVASGESAYYTITGANGKQLQLAAENAQIYCGEETLLPDENGVIRLSITQDTQQIEVCNTDSQENTFVVKIHYREGHMLNPQVLKQLGDELIAQTSATEGGHYYSYTAKDSGVVTFRIWTAPDNASAISKILLTNNTTGETAELADAEGAVSMQVSAGDELSVCVTVENIFGAGLDSQLSILGNHFGTAEDPIVVEYPGFTANVPAGQTLYYQCYNMNGILFSMNESNVTVSHNGTEHTGEQIAFTVVSEGRNPAVFAITNTGTGGAKYEVTFSYPLGWMENPDTLVLGTNILTRKAGEGSYYYTFTAPKAGRLILDFSQGAQWTYTLNNLTHGLYGDTQWSDSDPVVAQPEIQVNENDQIQIIVNTYDQNNVNENPAGSVVFGASFITGPVEITNTGTFTTATLVAGETCEFTGQFQGLILKITGSGNASVEFGGQVYPADDTGTIKVEMPKNGTEKLSFFLHNGAADQAVLTIVFNVEGVGTAENPEILTTGSHSMTQSVVGGADYHYKFVSTSAGTLLLTFEKDVDCVFTVKGTIVRYSHKGQVRYALRVKANEEISLVVNTYDPDNPDAHPVGVVDFTVEYM